jgi:hypothetical protein
LSGPQLSIEYKAEARGKAEMIAALFQRGGRLRQRVVKPAFDDRRARMTRLHPGTKKPRTMPGLLSS